MTREKSVDYQTQKIKQQEMYIGYYQDKLKDSWMVACERDQVEEQIAYHTRLLAYHQKRRVLIMRGA